MMTCHTARKSTTKRILLFISLTAVVLAQSTSLHAEEPVVRNVPNPAKINSENAITLRTDKEAEINTCTPDTAKENIELKKLVDLQKEKIEILEAYIKELEKKDGQ